MGFARGRGIAAVVATAAIAVALVFGESSSALATDGITFTQPTQTVEYGQNWFVGGTITPESAPDSDYGSLVVTTGSITKNLGTHDLYNGAFDFGDADFELGLGVGTHSISVAFTGGSATAASTTPAVVTITAAPLLATTTIAPDPNNSHNAIITSQLTGKFVDQLPSCQCEDQDGYLLPAGSWSLTVTDSKGKTVLTKQLNQAASGVPTFVNYWQSVPAGETFSAQSTFTPTGGAASNFTLTSQKFSWTSGRATGGGATSPSNTPEPRSITNAAFAPPILVFYAALLVALILIALDVLLLVRRRRSQRTTAQLATGTES